MLDLHQVGKGVDVDEEAGMDLFVSLVVEATEDVPGVLVFDWAYTPDLYGAVYEVTESQTQYFIPVLRSVSSALALGGLIELGRIADTFESFGLNKDEMADYLDRFISEHPVWDPAVDDGFWMRLTPLGREYSVRAGIPGAAH